LEDHTRPPSIACWIMWLLDLVYIQYQYSNWLNTMHIMSSCSGLAYIWTVKISESSVEAHCMCCTATYTGENLPQIHSLKRFTLILSVQWNFSLHWRKVFMTSWCYLMPVFNQSYYTYITSIGTCRKFLKGVNQYTTLNVVCIYQELMPSCS